MQNDELMSHSTFNKFSIACVAGDELEIEIIFESTSDIMGYLMNCTLNPLLTAFFGGGGGGGGENCTIFVIFPPIRD